MVSKNRGLVKHGCCVVPPLPPCVPPTAGAVTVNTILPPDSDRLITDSTVTYTNGTSFQWWFGTPLQGGGYLYAPFVDQKNVMGSTTPTLITVVDRANPPAGRPVYCIVTNACGSAKSATVFIPFIFLV